MDRNTDTNPFTYIPSLEEWLAVQEMDWSPEAEAEYWDWREEEAREA